MKKDFNKNNGYNYNFFALVTKENNIYAIIEKFTHRAENIEILLYNLSDSSEKIERFFYNKGRFEEFCYVHVPFNKKLNDLQNKNLQEFLSKYKLTLDDKVSLKKFILL